MYRIARACFEKGLVGSLRVPSSRRMAQQQRRKARQDAVITCGTEGIGFATAKLFVKEGAYVFITGRRQKELDEAVKAIGTNVYGVQGDVAKLAIFVLLYETAAGVK